MIAQTIYTKFLRTVPLHIYILGVKKELPDIERQILAWGLVKTFMEIHKKEFKQLEYKNNVSYILDNIKKLKV